MLDATRLTLLLASTLTVMSGATISPALPAIEAAFAGTAGAATMTRLVLTMPALFIVLVAPFAGAIAARTGKRTLLLAGLVLYAVAGTSGALAPDLVTLLVGRAGLGIAVAFVMTMSVTLIADLYEGPERSRMLGLQAAFASGGGIVFILLGGALAEISWHGPFLVYLASLALIPAVLAAIPRPASGRPAPATAPDWPVIAPVLVVALSVMLAFYLIPVQLPFHLAGRFGVPPVWVGASVATVTLFGFVASMNFGRLRARLAVTRLLTLALAVMAAGYVVIGLATALPVLLAGVALTGLGLGVAMPGLSDWLTARAGVAGRAGAVGALTSAIFLGQFASPLLSQPVAEAWSLEVAYLAGGALMAALAGWMALRSAREPAAA